MGARTIVRTMSLAILAMLCTLSPGSIPRCVAQPVDVAAFEGYIFDRETLKPLSNARVEIRLFLVENADRLILSTISDGNGYYALQVPPIATSVRTEIEAKCLTRKGAVNSGGTGYAPLRAEVYQRNLYVTLPRRETQCILQ